MPRGRGQSSILRTVRRMTHPTLLKLNKVLELERRQGCEDRAVVGGLGRFLDHWRGEAMGQLPDELVQDVVAGLERYDTLSPATRRARVDAALRSTLRERGAPAPGRSAGERREARPLRREDDPALASPVTAVRGVGEKAAERLARLGVTAVIDLLLHFPHRHRDFSRVVPIGRVEPGSDVTVVGTVADVRRTRGRSGRSVLWVLLEDTTGRVRLCFFNQPYLAKSFARGRTIAASGRVELRAGRALLSAPEWEPVGKGQIHTGRLLPIYPASEGISQRWLRRHVGTAVEQCAQGLGDPLPPWIRETEGLLSRPDAVRAIHQPEDRAALREGERRLGFDEMLGLQLWARRRRNVRARRSVASLHAGAAEVDRFVERLPWPLTADQHAAIEVLRGDLGRDRPMSRLLQGDVGCGKTVVAAAAIAQCAAAGRQSAIMVPTEILARQHFRSLRELLAPGGWRVFDPASPQVEGEDAGDGPRLALLVGSLRPADKEAVRQAARKGDVAAVVGTQALIQRGVELPRQALSIVDEQHRFGVLQRAVLDGAANSTADSGGAIGAIGPTVHSLVMTATPIPRTLFHVLHADLEQTVIEEMPRGRKPIETEWLLPEQRERAYQYIRHAVTQPDEDGHPAQAYIIYPLVEESEHIEARAAADDFATLRDEVFPGIPMALLHGRLPAAEKEAAMRAFHEGEARILVSTTVVEVGVDVPDATIMLIDGAERFGLAQLHQLRGRIGRGQKASTCLLLTGRVSATARKRLSAMTELVRDERSGRRRLRNGLELARRDLTLRGPGDYFGTRQAGLVDRFRFARLGDVELLAAVGRVAETVLERDPNLAAGDHAGLRGLSLPYHEGASRK